jgi:NAD(P)-dependent dehydrogenase (short-subunit alcohol dehydrogenase family)
MAAWYPMPGCNLYNASKAALRWIGIGLQGELASFGIKHCLIEPGFFRTELLNPTANMAKSGEKSRLQDYAELNATNDKNFDAFHGNQLGDPVRGAEIIFDVLTSSGIASGREVPPFLPLGSDAASEITKSAEQTIKQVKEWADVSSMSDFPSEK